MSKATMSINSPLRYIACGLEISSTEDIELVIKAAWQSWPRPKSDLANPLVRIARDIFALQAVQRVKKEEGELCWHKHRRELLDSCGPGRRPWAYWSLEKGMKFKPTGEAGELRLIRQLELYRDDAEQAYVERRLAEINEEMHARRHFSRVA